MLGVRHQLHSSRKFRQVVRLLESRMDAVHRVTELRGDRELLTPRTPRLGDVRKYDPTRALRPWMRLRAF